MVSVFYELRGLKNWSFSMTDLHKISRVVVQVENGQVVYATTPKRARDEYEVVPDVLFVRNDGWSLGARFEDEAAAFDLWADCWEKRINLKTGEVTLF